MADIDVIGQAMERAEKISGQLVQRLRQSMNELDAIRRDIRSAKSLAGDAEGLGDTIAQLDRAFDEVAAPAKEIVKTLDTLQDSVRAVVKTVGELGNQQDAAERQAEKAADQATGTDRVDGPEGVRGVQGVRR